MKTIIHKTIISISLLFFFSCAEKQQIEAAKNDDITEIDNFEEWAKRQVETLLKINATENYTMTIHEDFLDRDTLIDAVILVNREEYAKIQEEKLEEMSEKYSGGGNTRVIKIGGGNQ